MDCCLKPTFLIQLANSPSSCAIFRWMSPPNHCLVKLKAAESAKEKCGSQAGVDLAGLAAGLARADEGTLGDPRDQPSGKRLQKTMENHHALNGKSAISTGPFSIVM